MGKPATQVQHAETKLRQLILNMNIRPGERMTERHIEGMLGVSRTSVRTALLHLVNEGLVSQQGRGWIVSPIDLDEISQLCTYRKILELGAIGHCTPAIIRSDIAQGEQLLSAAASMTAYEECDQAGYDFHLWIATLSRNDFVIQGVENATLRLRRARWLADDHNRNEWDEHRAIVAALKEADLTKASRLTEDFLQRKRQKLLGVLQEKKKLLTEQGALFFPV
ncbi:MULTISPECIES: GntR family transcriptional regulator [unclassified Saccharibacter]|uniref:GntR family transcriptional regulator n=1 Tax=unclassified Saccharibacter TaxID=2648722 RepID=UPI00132B8E2D|nr:MULTISPECIES: GntR family transcriptional regulator [unclassified Saccharibacter]MXV36977.1 GntR family transcriptional regulator [Saccharibacter sp. EH611]MXV58533.1 GntR family transcriptional regulator [Saccharibacter sp. EH70]MXV66039.1 GntR family transcriptional regulator [Saccharibacter sp. EH60]